MDVAPNATAAITAIATAHCLSLMASELIIAPYGWIPRRRVSPDGAQSFGERLSTPGPDVPSRPRRPGHLVAAPRGLERHWQPATSRRWLEPLLPRARHRWRCRRPRS